MDKNDSKEILMKKIQEEESMTTIPAEDFFETSQIDYDAFDDNAWKKGNGYTAPNFPLLSEKMEGLESGLFMIAGESNAGKTNIVMNLLIDFCTNIKNNLFCIYFSLDDTANELIPRLIAMHESIPISVGSKPQRYQDYIDTGREGSSDIEILIEKRKHGLEWLRSINKQFKIVDSNKVKCGEQIYDYIAKVQMYLAVHAPEKKLIIGIDSMSDIRFSTKKFSSDKERNDYIARTVKEWSVEFDIPIFGTLHLRKIEQNRRPTIADVKESGEYAYEASFLGIVYNDVSRNKQSATVYQTDINTGEKLPVIELDWAKNKKSSFKGRTYHYFQPNYSLVIECSEEAASRYDTLIYTN